MQTRLFMGSDFEAVARIMGSSWHDRHGAQSYWHGADELCVYLAQSDYGIVTLDDAGNLTGVILLRSPRAQDHNENLRSHWMRQRTELATMARVLGINSQAEAPVLVKEAALLQRSANQRGTEGVGLIELIIVSSNARGTGVGRTLLQEGLSWLEERGCKTLRLLTDDGCDWQFYEHLGMERVDADVVTVEVPNDTASDSDDENLANKVTAEHLDIGIYVYEGPLREVAARL